MARGVAAHDVRYLGVEGEDLAEFSRPGAGALLDQLALRGDGAHVAAKALRHAQRRSQVGVRVGIDGEHAPALTGVEERQRACQGGLAYPPFARDSELQRHASLTGWFGQET